MTVARRLALIVLNGVALAAVFHTALRVLFS